MKDLLQLPRRSEIWPLPVTCLWETIPAPTLTVPAMTWPPQFWGWSVPALSLGGYRVKVWKVPTVLAPICLVSFLGWLKSFNVQLLPSFLVSGLSAEHDHWGDKRVHKYIWCTLISNSNILWFAALTLFRDCQIFVTYGLKRALFFLCFFLFVLSWLPLKTEQLDCYRNSPSEPLSFSFFLRGSVWVIHLHSINFSYPGECSVDSGSKYRVHSKLGVMFSVPRGPPREPGPWRMRWCSSPGAAWCQKWGSRVRVQVSLNTVLLGYSPPGCARCGTNLMVHLVGEFREARPQGQAVCFPGWQSQRPGCRSGWPQARVYYSVCSCCLKVVWFTGTQ